MITATFNLYNPATGRVADSGAVGARDMPQVFEMIKDQRDKYRAADERLILANICIQQVGGSGIPLLADANIDEADEMFEPKLPKKATPTQVNPNAKNKD